MLTARVLRAMPAVVSRVAPSLLTLTPVLVPLVTLFIALPVVLLLVLDTPVLETPVLEMLVLRLVVGEDDEVTMLTMFTCDPAGR